MNNFLTVGFGKLLYGQLSVISVFSKRIDSFSRHCTSGHSWDHFVCSTLYQGVTVPCRAGQYFIVDKQRWAFTAIQVTVYEMVQRIQVKLSPGFTRENWHSKRIRLFLPANWTLIYGKLVKYYVWSLAFYGAETWTLRTVDQNSLESFEMWCWKRMEMIWTDLARNE